MCVFVCVCLCVLCFVLAKATDAARKRRRRSGDQPARAQNQSVAARAARAKRAQCSAGLRVARTALPEFETNIEALVGQPHRLGAVATCTHCAARYWPEERTTSGKFTLCCMEGRVHGALPLLLDHSDDYERLLQGQGRDAQDSKLFLDNIRMYNNRFAMTSVSAKFESKDLAKGAGPHAIVLQGALHHSISPLLPGQNAAPAFAQVYMYDAEAQLDTRLKFCPSSGHKFSHIQDRRIMIRLQRVLEEDNPPPRLFQVAHDRLREEEKKHPEAKTAFKIVLAADPSSSEVDKRRFALPSSEEVAIIVDAADKKRDILLQLRPEQLMPRIRWGFSPFTRHTASTFLWPTHSAFRRPR